MRYNRHLAITYKDAASEPELGITDLDGEKVGLAERPS